MTHSEENYIKGIYHLSQGGKKAISTNALAGRMETKPSSVTDMVKRLSDKGLVHYKKYQGVRLTEQGTRQALKVIRKHRLWETFLVQKLDFSWDEVHEVAEQLEHIESEKLIDRLDALLDFPEYDPHGDPIPDKDGKFKIRDKKLLSNMPVPSQAVCVGVRDSSAPFLKFLDRNHIALGREIKILEKEPYDHSMHVQIGGHTLRISNQIASNLYVKPNIP